MGTNYYLRIPSKAPDRDEKKLLKFMIEYNLFDDLKEYLEGKNFYRWYNIHLGKNSYGWKFIFNTNLGKYYSLTRNGINMFINRERAVIVDEYGSEITPSEFWEVVDKEGGFDLESYYSSNPNEKKYYIRGSDIPKELVEYNPNQYGEFYNDGLLFTISTEFS